MANKLKMIRDNENVSPRGETFESKDISVRTENVLSQDNVSPHGDKLATKDLSTVLYAIIRRLNYLYDTTTDKDRREAILDKKARLIIQLLLLEDK